MKRIRSVLAALALAVPLAVPASLQAFAVSTGVIVINGDSGFGMCGCVSSGTGTASDPYVIGNLTIQSDTTPGISIMGTSKSFVLNHPTVHTNGLADGILLSGVTGPAWINHANVDTPGSLAVAAVNNGIELINTSRVTVTGDSINTNGGWGVRLENSSHNVITFMNLNHNGLSNPDSVGSASISFSDPSNPWIAGVSGNATGGLLIKGGSGNTVSDDLFNEDAYAGFVLVNTSGNTVQRVNVRYPDYFGGIVESSDGNTLDTVSLQTADFDGLLVRASNNNTFTNNTYSANGPIGNEWNAHVVPYFIAGAYVGWGSDHNTFIGNNGNFGNTGPDLVLDDGTLLTKANEGFFFNGSLQSNNPFNFLSTYRSLGVKSLAAGSHNTVCGNSFAPNYWYPSSLNANTSC